MRFRKTLFQKLDQDICEVLHCETLRLINSVVRFANYFAHVSRIESCNQSRNETESHSERLHTKIVVSRCNARDTIH